MFRNFFQYKANDFAAFYSCKIKYKANIGGYRMHIFIWSSLKLGEMFKIKSKVACLYLKIGDMNKKKTYLKKCRQREYFRFKMQCGKSIIMVIIGNNKS